MDFIKNWLAILAKRVSKGAFWLEVLVALLVGGGTFWGVKALRDEGLLMGQELLHHDLLHLRQVPGSRDALCCVRPSRVAVAPLLGLPRLERHSPS